LNPYLSALIAALGAIAVGWFGYLASRAKQRADTGQQMIDQHQEDIRELRSERRTDSQRMDRLERIVREQGDYIGELRRHIADGRPPPPPPYPQGLIP
jgi:uncharacterized membrane protein YccC